MKAADIVGYRFNPSDKELVSHHLKRRLLGIQENTSLIPVLNIYDHEPWALRNIYSVKSVEKSPGKCFFFCPRSNGGGSRTNRKTGGGFWKDTSRKRIIKAGKTVGIKRILVFYEGKQKDSRKTDWVMHEYHLNALDEGTVDDLRAFALCCFKRKPTMKKKEKSPVSVCEANLSSPSSSTAIVEVEVPNQEQLQIENAVIDTNEFIVDELFGDGEETSQAMSNDSINPLFQHHQMEEILPTDDATVSDTNGFFVDELPLQNIGDDEETGLVMSNYGIPEMLLPADYATASSGEQDNSLMGLFDFDKIEDVLCCPDFNQLWTQ